MSKTSTVKIYLAPANHYNAYCISGYDEKTQCEKLSGLVQRELEAYEGVSVYAATVFSERAARRRLRRSARTIILPSTTTPTTAPTAARRHSTIPTARGRRRWQRRWPSG